MHAVGLYLLLQASIKIKNKKNNSDIREIGIKLFSQPISLQCLSNIWGLSWCFITICTTPWFSISVMHGVTPHKNAFHWRLAESRIHTSSLLCWKTSKGWATNRLQHLLTVGLKLCAYKMMTTLSLKWKLLMFHCYCRACETAFRTYGFNIKPGIFSIAPRCRFCHWEDY